MRVGGCELTGAGEPACGGSGGEERRQEDGAEFHDGMYQAVGVVSGRLGLLRWEVSARV